MVKGWNSVPRRESSTTRKGDPECEERETVVSVALGMHRLNGIWNMDYERLEHDSRQLLSSMGNKP